MHADDEHLLVVRPVEDPDLSARRQPLLIAAEEVLVELALGGDLEALHAHTLRVDAAHHVADRPVLSCGIERLDHDEHAVCVLSREARLVLRQQLDAVPQEPGTVLLLLESCLEGRIEVLLQVHARVWGDAERLDETRYSLGDVFCHLGMQPKHLGLRAVPESAAAPISCAKAAWRSRESDWRDAPTHA